MHVLFVKEIPDHADAAADIMIDTKYLCCTVRVSDVVLEMWRNKKWWTVAEIMCHEMSHVLTEPLFEAALPAFKRHTEHLYDMRERQTQRVCVALMRLTPKSAWMPK
jgi:hypothetical protein